MEEEESPLRKANSSSLLMEKEPKTEAELWHDLLNEGEDIREKADIPVKRKRNKKKRQEELRDDAAGVENNEDDRDVDPEDEKRRKQLAEEAEAEIQRQLAEIERKRRKKERRELRKERERQELQQEQDQDDISSSMFKSKSLLDVNRGKKDRSPSPMTSTASSKSESKKDDSSEEREERRRRRRERKEARAKLDQQRSENADENVTQTAEHKKDKKKLLSEIATGTTFSFDEPPISSPPDYHPSIITPPGNDKREEEMMTPDPQVKFEIGPPTSAGSEKLSPFSEFAGVGEEDVAVEEEDDNNNNNNDKNEGDDDEDDQIFIEGESVQMRKNRSFDGKPSNPDSLMSIAGSSTPSTRPKKKRSSTSYLSNLINPTYKSRSDDFRKVFTVLPADERLIIDYSCALQKDILVHGRLYVTKNFLCFYANIFRWETSVLIRWIDVVNMTREKTALVIPNAIQVTTGDKEKHFFTSFSSREKTFQMLYKMWQNSQSKMPATSSELWGIIHHAYGDDLGLTTDDDADYEKPPALQENCLLNSENSSDWSRAKRGVGAAAGDNEAISSNESPGQDCRRAEGDDDLHSSTTSKIYQAQLTPTSGGARYKKKRMARGAKKDKKGSKKKDKEAVASSDDEANLDFEIDGEDDEFGSDEEGGEKRGKSHKKNAAETMEKWKKNLSAKEIINAKFPVNVDTLFELLFTKSKFYIEFHSARKTFDIVQSPWQPVPNSNDKKREVKLTLSLTHPMGPKHSPVTEMQTMSSEFTEPGSSYAIDVDTVNSGIPYADSFYVTIHYFLARVSSKESRLCVHGGIHYKKTVWGLVKTFIEKNAWSGLEEFFTSISRALQEECEDLSGENRGRRVSGGNASAPPGEPETMTSENARRLNSGPPNGIIGNPNPKKPDRASKADLSSSPSPFAPGSIFRSLGSIFSFGGNRDVSFRAILVLLTMLLCANSLLFYQMWALESRMSIDAFNSKVSGSAYEHLKYWDAATILGATEENERTTEQWLQLLRKQEAVHQMELEKWHEMLEMATELLRKTEGSLANLQKSIHPLTLQKLRGLLFLKEEEDKLGMKDGNKAEL